MSSRLECADDDFHDVVEAPAVRSRATLCGLRRDVRNVRGLRLPCFLHEGTGERSVDRAVVRRVPLEMVPRHNGDSSRQRPMTAARVDNRRPCCQRPTPRTSRKTRRIVSIPDHSRSTNSCTDRGLHRPTPCTSSKWVARTSATRSSYSPAVATAPPFCSARISRSRSAFRGSTRRYEEVPPELKLARVADLTVQGELENAISVSPFLLSAVNFFSVLLRILQVSYNRDRKIAIGDRHVPTHIGRPHA